MARSFTVQTADHEIDLLIIEDPHRGGACTARYGNDLLPPVFVHCKPDDGGSGAESLLDEAIFLALSDIEANVGRIVRLDAARPRLVAAVRSAAHAGS